MLSKFHCRTFSTKKHHPARALAIGFEMKQKRFKGRKWPEPIIERVKAAAEARKKAEEEARGKKNDEAGERHGAGKRSKCNVA